ncbi:unconventional prefoldin RPB5 interactor-like [Mizuhopecten yessoensis]|uniref:unconventional prefoldin RPB5 interactor-like n=1 Tax=Mizuhopecten yessoensis TaxID=6573 RepID=UPI000B45D304|nr:unconventional prefoldin RPB5 interactor-like [Mizuhopecten yessoensis]
MSYQQFSRLKEEQEKAIIETNIKLEKWEQFKSDYEALKTRLKTLPDKVSHDVMVPFGSLAFMPGKLVHTNEVLVLLGDNWFAERSAKQAAAIVGRRLKDVESQIDGLKQQKKILSPRLEFTTDLKKSAVEQGVVDITEEYDEMKEKHWREQHRKRVQELKKKKKVSKDKDGGSVGQSQGQGQPITDEQLWARLDELERIEAEGNELQMLGTEDEVCLSLPPQSDEDEDEDEESALSTSDGSEQEDSRRISFTHTKVDETEEKEKETSGKIESPRDIYQQFCDSKPKSILKSNTTDGGQKAKVKKKVKMKEDISAEESRKGRGMGQGPLAFSGTVIEKNQDFQMKNFEDKNSDKSVLNAGEIKHSSDIRRHCTGEAEVGVKDDTQPRRMSKFKAGRLK